MHLALLVHLAATLLMAGIIWFVQVVHYPLFRKVGPAAVVAHAAEPVRRTTRVVGPPLAVEGATGAILLLTRPAEVPATRVWVGFELPVLVWLSTVLLQVPRHRLLTGGFDPAVGGALVATNRLRTAGWTARAVLVLVMVERAMG